MLVRPIDAGSRLNEWTRMPIQGEGERMCVDTIRDDTILHSVEREKKTRLRDSFQKGILSGIARVPARSGRATSGGQIDDSQRAVWRNLAGPGG